MSFTTNKYGLLNYRHQNLGDIVIKVSSRSSRFVTMRHHKKYGLLLTVPRNFSRKKMMSYVEENHQVITSYFTPIHAAIEKKLLSMEKSVTTLGGIYHFQFHHGEKIKVAQGNPNIIFIPETWQEDPQALSALLYQAVIKELRKQARQIIPEKTAKFSHRYKLPFEKISIRDMTSRWGSCSHQNHLSFNVHLMRLSEEQLDYVIKHELAHVREKNHGPNFWKLLDSMTDGRARLLSKQLKQIDMLSW